MIHKSDQPQRSTLLLFVLALLLALPGSSGADDVKSLYVNADLNGGSPIRAYAIQPPSTYLTYQDVSNTTGYGGAGLAIDTDSATLFVTFEGAGSLKIVDATTLYVPGAGVPAPGASNLAGIVVDQERQKVYTVDRNTDKLFQYSWDAIGNVLTLDGQYTLPGLYFTGWHGNGAHGIALDEQSDLLYVADVSNNVKVYNTSDWSLASQVYVATQKPMGVALDEVRGFLYSGNAYPGYGCTGHLVKTDLNTSPPTETTVDVRIETGYSNDCVVGQAVDLDTGLVYITTGNQGTGGSDRIMVFDSDLSHLYSTSDIGNPTGIVVPSQAISYNPLNLSKEDGLGEEDCAYPGDEITYDLCYDNTANAYDAHNVVLADVLPAEVNFVDATGGGIYYDSPPEVEWYLGDLAAGATQQCVQLTVEIDPSTAPGSVITNTADISSDDTGPAYASEDTEVCPNQPPVVTPDHDPVVVDEGQTAANTGTVSDPDDNPVTLSASVGTIVNHGDGTWSWSYPTTDGPADSQTVTITGDDGQGGVSQVEFTLTVHNVAPSVGPITVDQPVVEVGTPINVSSPFTDPGTGDTHTAMWDWDDGTTQPGTVTQGAGFGSVDDGHTYGLPGVYEIELTVTDDDGASGQAVFRYVVVYDPSAGFVTGGGWIDSPPGAYVPAPALTGKANFGFVSKYKKGATVPTGNTEFQFHAAGLNFHSSGYQWLVVTGSKYARFKGDGTVNGMGSYKFMIWAGDANPDTFRIKIWVEDGGGGETVIYDNGFDQALGGGSIVIHGK